MKLIASLLLLFVGLGLASPAAAQRKPKMKAKRAFAHTSESSRGKTDRARFRTGRNDRNPIDLNPGKLETFKTARANKPYTYPKPH